MKTLLTTLLFLLMNSLYVNAQTYNIEWQKCFGGTGLDDISGFDTTYDGGYIFCGQKTGNCNGSSNYDVWVVKTDDTGKVLWENCYGGTQSDWAKSIRTVPQANGGYIFTATTLSNDGDVSGNHGGADIWVGRIDDNGTLLWQKTFGGSGADIATSMTMSHDNNFVITGITFSTNGDATGNHGSADILVVKIPKEGTVLWKKVLGSSGQDDVTEIATNAADGNLLLSGMAWTADGDVSSCITGGDWWLVKLNNTTGNIIWEKTFGTNIYYEEISGIAVTLDNGILAWGYINGNNVMKKMDAFGTVEWSSNITAATTTAVTASAFQFPDSSYLINRPQFGGLFAGDTSTNAGLMNLDKNGDSTGIKLYGGSDDDAFFKGIYFKGGYTFIGATSSNDMDVSGNHGMRDIWMVRMKKNTTDVQETVAAASDIILYPNPATAVLHFSKEAYFSIENAVGKQIISRTKASTVNVANLASGVYFVSFYNDKGQLINHQKLLKN